MNTLAAPNPTPNTSVPAYAQGKPYADSFPIIAREGWPLVALFATISAAASTALLTWSPVVGGAVGLLGALLTGWCIWFFRDPARVIPTEAGAVICPADGVVVKVEPGVPPAELGLSSAESSGMTKISIFMNVFNVHVNRSPLAGTIRRIAYTPGAFFNASFDKASELNERCAYAIDTETRQTIAMVQIAGLVARRIVVKTREGARLAAGERYGLIRFGSRVDVYLPRGSRIGVKLGEKTVAGETILASLPAAAPPTEARR